MSIASDRYQKAAETRLANLDYLKCEVLADFGKGLVAAAIADRHEISDSRVSAYLREARKKIPAYCDTEPSADRAIPRP